MATSWGGSNTPQERWIESIGWCASCSSSWSRSLRVCLQCSVLSRIFRLVLYFLLLSFPFSPLAMSTEPPVANFVDGTTFRNVGETCPIYFDVGAPIRFKAIVGEKSFEYTEACLGLYNTTAPLKIWKRGINPDAESSSDDDYCSNEIITRTTYASTVFTIPPTYKAGKYTLSLRGGHLFTGSSREGDKTVSQSSWLSSRLIVPSLSLFRHQRCRL